MRLTVAAAGHDAIAGLWGKPSHVIDVLGPNARKLRIRTSVKLGDDPGLLGAKTGRLVPGVYNITTLSGTPGGDRIVTVLLKAPTQSALHDDLAKIREAVGLQDHAHRGS
jgi:D-alanyl-D-alanine carboxypeptidase